MHIIAIQVDTGWLWAAAALAAAGVPLLWLCWVTDRSRDRRWHEERHYARQPRYWDTAIEAQAAYTAAAGAAAEALEAWTAVAQEGMPYDYEAEAEDDG